MLQPFQIGKHWHKKISLTVRSTVFSFANFRLLFKEKNWEFSRCLRSPRLNIIYNKISKDKISCSDVKRWMWLTVSIVKSIVKKLKWIHMYMNFKTELIGIITINNDEV